MSEPEKTIPDDLPLDERRRIFREELAREREQQAARRRPQAEEMRPVGYAPWLRHLAAFVEDAPPPEPSPVDLQKERIARRRQYLKSAGDLDIDAIEACAPALDACPRVVGHPGSERAAAAVERFIRTREIRTLLLIGAAGRGKTWAATWAIAESGGVWICGADVRVGEPWDERREKAARASVLVFDELGREGGSEWHANEVCSLLETRQTQGRKTLVTTNVPLRIDLVSEKARPKWLGRTIFDRYGERFISRFTDTRTGIVEACVGWDLRGGERAEREWRANRGEA